MLLLDMSGVVERLTDSLNRNAALSDSGPGEDLLALITSHARLAGEVERWREEALRQYPTPEAYDAVCAARTEWQVRAQAAEAQRDTAHKRIVLLAEECERHVAAVGEIAVQRNALETERDAAQAQHLHLRECMEGYKATCAVWEARTLAVEARLSMVEEALKPFADTPDKVSVWNGSSHDEVSPPDHESAVIFNITWGDLRKARQARAAAIGGGLEEDLGAAREPSPAITALGWRLVPEEPTEAMRLAGWEADGGDRDDPHPRVPEILREYDGIWRAMLAAAHTPAVDGGLDDRHSDTGQLRADPKP